MIHMETSITLCDKSPMDSVLQAYKVSKCLALSIDRDVCSPTLVSIVPTNSNMTAFIVNWLFLIPSVIYIRCCSKIFY